MGAQTDIHRGSTMNICRTIFALLIALSVATLPAAGGVAAIAQSADMSMPVSMDDCDRAVMPCHKAMDDCQSMAACALKCFNYSETSFLIVTFPVLLADRTAAFAADLFRGQTIGTPFRPPRV
jgi:hypothetical protein